MKSKKRYASWRVYAVTAAACMASTLIWADMVRQGRADGMSVLLVLVFLVDAAVFAVRAVHAFHQQKSDKKVTEDNNIADGGIIHD